MFSWDVEKMSLLNDKHVKYLNNNQKIYSCENKVSREEKIEFVDKYTDGKLSYLLSLIEKFEKEKGMPKDTWGNVKTVSLKAWIKRNDTKYPFHVIDDYYKYGEYVILGSTRVITSNHKYRYDIYEDLVDEAFHRQLANCEKEEKKYFLQHDEYSILKEKLKKMEDQYNTSFGVHVSFCSNGSIYIVDEEDYKRKREITKEELKDLLAKYEQLDKLKEELTSKTNIVY